MKRLLSFVAGALLLSAVCVQAQNPSFKSFDPTQFSTNGFVIRIIAQAFQGTNALGNVYVTNLFVTNITVTGTLIVSNSTVMTLINLNTNQFNTNQFSTDGTVSLKLGTTPHVPYWDGTWLGDTAMVRDSTNSVAVEQANVNVVVVTNLAAGGVVKANATSGMLDLIGAGSGVLTNNGANALGWFPAASVGTKINPTDTFIPYRSNATTFADSPLFTDGSNVTLTNGGQLILKGASSGSVFASGSADNSVLIFADPTTSKVNLSTVDSQIQLVIDPITQIPSLTLSQTGGFQAFLSSGPGTNTIPFFIETPVRAAGSEPFMLLQNGPTTEFSVTSDGGFFANGSTGSWGDPGFTYGQLQGAPERDLTIYDTLQLGGFSVAVDHQSAFVGVNAAATALGPPNQLGFTVQTNGLAELVGKSPAIGNASWLIADSGINAPAGQGFLYRSISAFTSTNSFAKFQNSTTNIMDLRGDGAATFKEVTVAPGVPAAGFYTIYAIDSGGGKMVLKVQFPSGAAQTIATEP